MIWTGLVVGLIVGALVMYGAWRLIKSADEENKTQK